MKTYILLVVLGLHLVYVQAVSVQSQSRGEENDSSLKQSLGQKWRSSVSLAIHHLASNTNLKQLMDTVDFGTKSGVSKSNIRCNMTAVGDRFEDLVDVISDYSTVTSAYVERVTYAVSACADIPFPRSVSCFLSLTKTCQPYVVAIIQIAHEFYPEFLAAGRTLYREVAKCVH